MNKKLCQDFKKSFTIRYNSFTKCKKYCTIKAMGKCKRRTLHKTNTSYFMTRETAVNNIFKMITDTSKKSKKSFDFRNALNTISLFGISAEELSEAGVPYENLKALGSSLN